MGPPGSTILANSSKCMHKAGVPEAGVLRDIMQFRIDPSIEPLRDDWDLHCEDSHSEIRNEESNVENRSIT